MEIFYQNENVIINSDFYDHELVVISFSPLVDEKQSINREGGFGKIFFQSKKISCIYITPTWNHWYQYDYIADAIEIIKIITKRFKKIVLYGVSMGGYGALQYANYLHATNVISISPQAVISGPPSEFDQRFTQFWDKIATKSDTWIAEGNQPINTTVFYDRYHNLDNKHAEIISKRIKHAKMISLPFSGHEVFAVLNEAKILSHFIFALVSENSSQSELVRLYRRNRHKSGVAWMYAAQLSASRGRVNSAKKLYEKSINVIEWRKRNGLNIDQAKARMTVMDYISYCFKTGDFASFVTIYEKFCDNKIITIELITKYLEFCVKHQEKQKFIQTMNTLRANPNGMSVHENNILKLAIESEFISETELVNF